jgi:hypothetical protein
MEQELKISVNPLFITLTYRDWHPPFRTDRALPQDKSVNKRDCQLFLKRLRKNYDTLQRRSGIEKSRRLKLKYFLVSEYGTHTKRAHYHLILLNLTEPRLIDKSWLCGHTYSPPLKGAASVTFLNTYLNRPNIQLVVSNLLGYSHPD